MNSQGKVIYQLKTPYENGTTRIVLDPLDFLSRLASLAPRPRTNLIRVPWCVCPEFQTPLPDHSKNQKSRETDNKVQKLFFNDLGHETEKSFWNGHRDLLGVWGKV